MKILTDIHYTTQTKLDKIRTANRLILYFFVGSCSFLGFAQKPTTPTFPTNTPIGVGQSQNFTPQQPTNPLKDSRDQEQIRIQEQNNEHQKKLGVNPPTQKEILSGNYYNQQAITKQQKTKELYELVNSANTPNKPIDPKEQERIARNKQLFRIADINSSTFKTALSKYEKAYTEIVAMLSGKTPLNLKRAVFVVENTYSMTSSKPVTLNYEKYCKQIDNLVFVCKQIMKENGYDPKQQMACHFAIQKLFSEQFNYKNTTGTSVNFEPFSYDFDDYFGEKDWSKMFVTKLLTTKKGQCHSMPLLYLILANELNVKAFLAIAPNHSYIKYGNQKQSFNFETTNGRLITDQTIIESGYISATAIQNKIYITPLETEQVIANCLGDLSAGLEYSFGKSEFTLSCANTALEYFPNSIQSALAINNILVARCANTAQHYGNPKQSEYSKYPDLKRDFDELLEYETMVENTGYQRIPTEQYELWKASMDEEVQKQEHLVLLEKLKQSASEK